MRWSLLVPLHVTYKSSQIHSKYSPPTQQITSDAEELPLDVDEVLQEASLVPFLEPVQGRDEVGEDLIDEVGEEGGPLAPPRLGHRGRSEQQQVTAQDRVLHDPELRVSWGQGCPAVDSCTGGGKGV